MRHYSIRIGNQSFLFSTLEEFWAIPAIADARRRTDFVDLEISDHGVVTAVIVTADAMASDPLIHIGFLGKSKPPFLLEPV